MSKNGTMVKIRFYGNLRDIVKKDTLNFALPPGSTVRDLIHLLDQKYGGDFSGYLLDVHGELWSHFSIVLNNQLLIKREQFDVTIKDNDEIMFLFPILGG